MKRFLLDTGIASDLVNRRLNVDVRTREASNRGDRIGIGTPVLGELIGGVLHSDDPQRNLKKLWQGLRGISYWPYDKAAAQEFGRLFAELRGLGRPMQQIDIQTAAIALSLGNCTVVTKDSDFAAVPGLDIDDWSIR